MKHGLILLVLSLILLVVLPFFGTISIGLSDVVSASKDSAAHEIFWSMRVPRVIFAFFVGAVLAIAGAAYQSLFRNVLVCPFSLGVSSAAALGASTAISTGLFAAFGGEVLLASLGALIGMGIVLAIGRFLPRDGTTSLLLCGVVLGFFFSSLVALVQYISDYAQLFRLSRWMLGALQVVGYQEVIIVGIISCAGAAVLFRFSNELNVLSLGRDLALTRGVSLDQVETIIFIVTSIMVGAVVALSGVIGFVGIMVPHMVRTMYGVDNRNVLPRSFWFGGVMLAVCDTIGRVLIPPYEVPVGVITAMLGGPFFIWLVTSRKASGGIG